AILKVFRKLEVGINPDLEVSRFLLEQTDFRSLPSLAGWIQYTGPRGVEMAVAGLSEFVPNRGDAWSYAITSLNRFLSAASRSAADPDSCSGKAALRRMAGDFFDSAARLGKVTAELLLALASGSTFQPDFAPEPITNED